MKVPIDDDVKPSRLGMISWERAGFYSRGINGDMARLLADLEAYRTVLEHHRVLQAHGLNVKSVIPVEPILRALDYLQSSLMSTYKRESKWLSELRLSPEHRRSRWERLVRKKELNCTSLISLERSAYLAHGLRMINLAFQMPWACMDPACLTGNGHTEVRQECRMVGFMIRRGLWYLRRATGSDEAFGDASNRTRIQLAQEWPGATWPFGNPRPWLPALFSRGDHPY